MKKKSLDKTTFATHPEFMDLDKLTVKSISDKSHILNRVSISATRVIDRAEPITVTLGENTFSTRKEYVQRMKATFFVIGEDKEFMELKKSLRLAFSKDQKFVINSIETYVELSNEIGYFCFWERKRDVKNKSMKILLTRIELFKNSKIVETTYFNKELSFDIDKIFGEIIGDMQFEGCRYLAGKTDKGFLCN